jgi:type II secretory pathway predicted ATPase ExeA
MKQELESSVGTAQITQEYLNLTGMSTVDFARRIGVDHATLHMFITGRHGTATRIRSERVAKLALGFMERNPMQANAPVSHGIYETATVRAMRKVFTDLLERPQIYLVEAPPGSGKTDVARHLIAAHSADAGADPTSHLFRIYCRACITPRDLLRRVAAACGTPSDISTDRTIQNLRFEFRGKRVVLYFDEAQHLSIDCFETVRELLDEDPRFSLCFAGSQVDAAIRRFAGSLEQLERRITDKITLPAVTAEEAEGILRSELSDFTIDTAGIREQIEAATITVRVERNNQRYISIGRLMAAIAQIRKGIAELEPLEQRMEAAFAAD